jgi:hypothetical protein
VIFYGPKVSGAEYRTLLELLFNTNRHSIARGLQPVPLCVWGLPGVGKTQSIRDFAAERSLGFLQINPAQFEEMGDITGMPRVHDGGTPADPHDDVTLYVMPEWAQRMHRLGGEGILLLDDVNRADDRILRGIMQLLQDRRMFNWHLPKGWQIMLTANPDGGDFSVTPMDQAMLTRMMHCTMEFHASAWAAWAERAGVDARGISFVLAYPELVGKGRTTPRSLTFLFEHLRGIDDVAQHAALVGLLAHSCVETEAAGAFIGYCGSSLARLPSPQELLGSNLESEILPRLSRIAFEESGAPKVDHLTVLVQRLLAHARSRTAPFDEQARKSLVAFLMWDRLPREVVRLAWTGAVDIEHLEFLRKVDRVARRT